ncbi:hypothetical protein LTR78_009419 [Recurvomyces mirabilis]|nr:hypothetical protein LTR78_009419 [Recurvomyces mirabilis]
MCAPAPGAPTICPFGATTPGASTTTNGIAPAVCAYFPTNATKVADSGKSQLCIDCRFVVSDGFTFYENRAYLSYQTAFATNTCGRLGATYAGGLLPVASSDVYSVSSYNYDLFDYAYSFNFADLNSPIPASAYLAMPDCAGSGNMGELQYPNKLNGVVAPVMCRQSSYVIYESLFQPVLAVPPEMRDLDPLWSQCELGLDGLWDPPRALQPASSEAAPTAPGQSNTLTITASPAQTPNSPAATTPGPTKTTPPVQSDTQGSSTGGQPQGGSAPSSSTRQADGNDQSSGNGGSNPSSKIGDGVSSAQSNAGSVPNGSANKASGISSNGASSDPSQNASPGAEISSADPGGIIISVIENQSTAQSQAMGGNSNDGGAATTQGSGSGSSNGGGTNNGGSNDGSSGDSSEGSGFNDSGGGSVVATVNSGTFIMAPTSNSEGSTAIVVAAGGSSATLTPGQTTSIGGQAVSAQSSGGGVVIGSGGSAAKTVPPGNSGAGNTNNGQASVVTVGSSAFTVLPTQSADSSGVVVANGGTTFTLKPGATTTLGGQVVSAPTSGGAIIGTGSTVATVQPTSANNGVNSGVIATVAGQTILADPSDPSGIIINGQTLTSGQTTTISGTPVYVASGSVLVGGSNKQPASTYAIPTAGSSAGGATVLGTVIADDKTLTLEQVPGSSQTLIVDGSSTVTLGSNGVATFAGVTLSAGSDNVGSPFLVVDGSQTVPLNGPATAAPQALITLGGETFTATEVGGSPSEIVIDGTTLRAGGAAATIDGTVISLGSAGLVLGGTQTIPFTSFQTPGTAQEALVTLNGQVYTASELSDGSSGVVIDGTTLHPGGPAATIHNVLVSDGPSGLVLAGTQTIPFSAIQTAPLGYEALLTFGNQVLTAIEPPGEAYVLLDGTTLSPGGPVATIDSTIISQRPNGLVIGGTKTIPPTPIPTSSALEALVTISGEIYTAIEPEGADFVIVDGTTLYPGGPAMMLYGTVISDGPDGLVVGGTKTVPLSRIPSMTPPPTPGTGVSVTPAAAAATGGHKKSASSSYSSHGADGVVVFLASAVAVLCLM